MTLQTVKFGRKRFVIVPEKDFRDLQKRAGGASMPRPRRSNARDRADIELAAKRLADPSERPIPYERVRKELGLA
jgi:hypothetical protein